MTTKGHPFMTSPCTVSCELCPLPRSGSVRASAARRAIVQWCAGTTTVYALDSRQASAPRRGKRSRWMLVGSTPASLATSAVSSRSVVAI